MAQRRMFSKSIARTDKFLDMPPSTQNLYFHLGIEADDDGFVSPKMVMRTLGCTDDEIKVLVAKGFVIPFESGVVVITDWKENNYIQADRYKPTVYQEEMNRLECIQNVYKLDTQVRIGKDRVVKERKELNTYTQQFEEFYKEFPSKRKGGKKTPYARWLKIDPSLYQTIIEDVRERKVSHWDWLKDDGQYIPSPEVYLNKEQWNYPLSQKPPEKPKFTNSGMSTL